MTTEEPPARETGGDMAADLLGGRLRAVRGQLKVRQRQVRSDAVLDFLVVEPLTEPIGNDQGTRDGELPPCRKAWMGGSGIIH